MINEALAKDLNATFGMTDPVGQVVDLPAIGYGSTRQPMTIVGIVKNERVQSDLARRPRHRVCAHRAGADALDQARRPHAAPTTRRSCRRCASALPPVDSRVALADVRTVEELRELSLSGMKEPAWLIGIFAAISAFLAALGLYGVVSHSVSQQRREIGIRMRSARDRARSCR